MCELISNNLKEIEETFKGVGVIINQRKDLKRLHKDNIFNRMYSVVLSSLVDVEILFLRLEKNLKNIEKISIKINKRSQKEDKEEISKEGQQLRKEMDKLKGEAFVDFKSVYIFLKIFFDKHVSLLRFLFNWRGIGDKSVTNFYNDLNSYDETDGDIVFFKEKCLNRLKAIDVFITQYRDDYIMHDQTGHKEITRWVIFENDNIRIFGKRPSITLNDMVFILSNYINDTSEFIESKFKIK
ncbi:hypothetical protein M0P25_04850 [archaeon]|nr:hypothetical protein [archaeon]MCK9439386.1 hypothetical protein [Patescibacteria group bacterium]MDD3919422.1 hypothetical protein [Candidatus Paceibacterota bacterium]